MNRSVDLSSWFRPFPDTGFPAAGLICPIRLTNVAGVTQDHSFKTGQNRANAASVCADAAFHHAMPARVGCLTHSWSALPGAPPQENVFLHKETRFVLS
jgi:hypothetical protein